jgi:hypothetical protein
MLAYSMLYPSSQLGADSVPVMWKLVGAGLEPPPPEPSFPVVRAAIPPTASTTAATSTHGVRTHSAAERRSGANAKVRSPAVPAPGAAPGGAQPPAAGGAAGGSAGAAAGGGAVLTGSRRAAGTSSCPPQPRQYREPAGMTTPQFAQSIEPGCAAPATVTAPSGAGSGRGGSCGCASPSIAHLPDVLG